MYSRLLTCVAMLFVRTLCAPMAAAEEWTRVISSFPEQYKRPSVMTGYGHLADFSVLTTSSPGFVLGSMGSDLSGRWLVAELYYSEGSPTGEPEVSRFIGLVVIDAQTTATRLIRLEGVAGGEAALNRLTAGVVRAARDCVVVEFRRVDGRMAPRWYEVRFAECANRRMGISTQRINDGALPDSRRYRYERIITAKVETLRIVDRRTSRVTQLHGPSFVSGGGYWPDVTGGSRYLLPAVPGNDAAVVMPVPDGDELPKELLMGINPDFADGVRWRIAFDSLRDVLADWEVRRPTQYAIRPAWSMATEPTVAAVALECDRLSLAANGIEYAVLCVVVDLTRGAVVNTWWLKGLLGLGRPIITADESAICIATDDPGQVGGYTVGLYAIKSGKQLAARRDLNVLAAPLAIRGTSRPEVIVTDPLEIDAASLKDTSAEERVLFSLRPGP